MRIRALLVACLVVIASLIALPADAAGSIQFRKIRYDSPGTDRGGKTSLNAEYVVIKNTGSTTPELDRMDGPRQSASRLHLSQLHIKAWKERQAA